jgi:hypothetical protein
MIVRTWRIVCTMHHIIQTFPPRAVARVFRYWCTHIDMLISPQLLDDAQLIVLAWISEYACGIRCREVSRSSIATYRNCLHKAITVLQSIQHDRRFPIKYVHLTMITPAYYHVWVLSKDHLLRYSFQRIAGREGTNVSSIVKLVQIEPIGSIVYDKSILLCVDCSAATLFKSAWRVA